MSLLRASVLRRHIFQSVITVRIITLICWFLEPLGFMCSLAVHERLLDASRLQCVFSFSVPVLYLQLDRSALVPQRTVLEAVQKLQHLLVHAVDLAVDALTRPGYVEQEGDVVFGGDHERVWLYGSSASEELGLTVDRIHHPEVVGLAFLQRAVDKDTSHVNHGTDDPDNELWRKRHVISIQNQLNI